MHVSNFINVGLAFALFVGVLICESLGHWRGRRELQRDRDAVKVGTSTIEAAVLALLGLLLAFDFSAAASRLERRRDHIVQESNAIGTAWLRLDLLPASDQPVIRNLFRRYTDERIAVVTALPDVDAALKHHADSVGIQSDIWTKCVESANSTPSPQASLLLIPALNEMIDITTTRSVAARVQTPRLITALIFIVALLSAFIAGYGMAESQRVNRIHVAVLAAVVSVTVYVILDLEQPRLGLIRLDDADRAMVEVRESMK